mgnify:CR=1 FL=1
MQNRYNQSSLENGLKIISSERKDSDVTTMELWVKAGSSYENKDQLGYTHFLEHMLSRGTKKRPDSFALNLERDKIGAYYTAVTGTKRVCFIIQFMHQYAENMMELLSDMIINSTLDSAAVNNEKRTILEELHKSKESKNKIVAVLSAREFFGNHPLSNDVIGTIESIEDITSEKLREYKEIFFVPSRSAIITTGKITHEEAILLTKKYFGIWLDNKNTPNMPTTVNPLSRRYVYKEDNSKLTYISLNYRTMGSTDQKETAAFSIIGQYLGYGHSSLLRQELRNLRGLIYDMSVNHILYNGDIGRFIIATSTTKPEETVKVIFESMNNLSSSLNADKLEEIKTQKTNTLIQLSEDMLNEAATLGWGFILYNRLITIEEIISQINQVTHNDIKNISKKYLIPKNSFLVVLGPKDIAGVINQPIS